MSELLNCKGSHAGGCKEASILLPANATFIFLPGVLPELLPLASLLAADPEWQRDAAGVASLCMSCLAGVAAGYRRLGDTLSEAILLEASLRKCVM